jgi:hypothetical protein
LSSFYRAVKTRQLLPVLQERLSTLEDTSPEAYGGFKERLDVFVGMEQPIGKEAFQQLVALRAEINRAVGLAGPRAPTDLRLGLQAVEDAHKQAGLHNARYVRNVEQARSAAQRIVGDDGKLVLASTLGRDELRNVRSDIKASPEKGLPQSVHALKMLKKLQEQPELQEVIESIKAPDPGSPACGLIRSVLNLPADFPVGKAEARRAAVASLLTKLRQHDVGSCFATSVAIQAQEKIPDVFLKDVKSLIETGAVERLKNDPTKPIRVRLGDDPKLHEKPAFREALTKLGVETGQQEEAINAALGRLRGRLQPDAVEFSFTPDEVLAAVQNALPGEGRSPEEQGAALEGAKAAYRNVGRVVMPLNPDADRSDLTQAVKVGEDFHEKPAIIAALDALGIPAAEMKKTVGDALQALRTRGPSQSPDLFSPEEVLDTIAARRPLRDNERSKRELGAAKLAFQAQQENVLLRAWEYTVASMAELDRDREEAIREPVNKAVTKALERLGATLKTEGNGAGTVDEFLANFRQQFGKRFQEQVAIRFDASVVIPGSDDGRSTAGVWVMRRNKDDSKVTDLASQEKMIKDLLAEVAKEFEGGPNGPFAHRLVESSKDQALSDGPPSQPDGAKLAEIEGLLGAFFGQDEPVALAKTRPVDASGLLAWMIEQNKVVRLVAGVATATDPGATLPMVGGPHAFSMKPGGAKLRALTDGMGRDGKTVEQSVADYVGRNKGTKDARLPLDLSDDGPILRVLRKACRLQPNVFELAKRRLAARRDTTKFVTPEGLKDEIAAILAERKSERDEECDTNKKTGRAEYGKIVLADTSPTAPAMARSGTAITNLIDRVLNSAGLKVDNLNGLKRSAQQLIYQRGESEGTVTPAQVKSIIDDLVAQEYPTAVTDQTPMPRRSALAREAVADEAEGAPRIAVNLGDNSAFMKLVTAAVQPIGPDLAGAAVKGVKEALRDRPDATVAEISKEVKKAVAAVVPKAVADPVSEATEAVAELTSGKELEFGDELTDLIKQGLARAGISGGDAEKITDYVTDELALEGTDDFTDDSVNPDSVTRFLKEALNKFSPKTQGAGQGQGPSGSEGQTEEALVKALAAAPDLLGEFTKAKGEAARGRCEAALVDAVGGADSPLREEIDRTPPSQFNQKVGAVVDAALSHLPPDRGQAMVAALRERVATLKGVTPAKLLEEIDKLYDREKIGTESLIRDAQATMTNDLAAAVVNELSPIDPGDFEGVVTAALEPLGFHVDMIHEVVKLLDPRSATIPQLEEAIAKAVDQINARGGPKLLLEPALILRPPPGPPGIVFADSNWEDSDTDNEVHFTMLVNPLTDELEMWQVNADGSDASRMDQAQWVSGKTWATPSNPAQTGPLV